MRGVIMETGNGRAVLLAKNGEFVNVKDKGYSVGDKVNISLNTGRLCAAAASLVIVCAGIGSYFMPAGYVSVDINPSLMMTVNIYNRVINVKSLNDDARVLLDKTDIKGKSAEASVEMLIKASEEIGYINDNNRSVILDVVSGITRPDIENVRYNNIDIIKETADMETFRAAQNIGVSIAKAKALEEYTEKNGGDIQSNAAKLNNKSVKEILSITRDNGNVSDKKANDTPMPYSKPQEITTDSVSKPPQTQENYQPAYSANHTSLQIDEPKLEEDIPSVNQSVLNEYRLPEFPSESNEQPHLDIAPINTQPAQSEQRLQEDNISQSKPQPTDEPENPSAGTKPIQTEQRPQDNTLRQSEDETRSEISEPGESAGGNDNPSASSQQQIEQKSQDGAPDQDDDNAQESPPQTGNQNPEANMPSDNQPAAEDRPQDNPAPPDEQKSESGAEQGGQPPQADNNPSQSEPNPQESAPKNSAPQNDGGSGGGGDMGGHGEGAQTP